MLAVLFLVCAVFFVMNPQLLGGPGGTRVSMDQSLDGGWVTDDGQEVDLSALGRIPGFDANGVTVHRQLPGKIESGIELNFLSVNCTFRLSYGGSLTYAYEPDPNEFGKSYEFHFNFAPLTPREAGKTATLEIKPTYSDTSSRILDIRMSGTTAYIQRYVRRHGMDFLISLLVSFVGAAIIVMHAVVRQVYEDDLDLLSLGTAAILLGIWSAAQTLVPQLITGGDMVIRALDHVSLFLAPYPMTLFACSLLHTKHHRIYERLSLVIMLLSFCTELSLAVFLHYDTHQLHIVTQAHLVASAIVILNAIFESYRENDRSLWNSVRKANRAILIAYLLLFCCAVTDFLVFNLSQRGVTDTARFMRMGLFVFVVVLAIEAFRASLHVVQRVMHADEIEVIAYTDALTQIGNRTAWQVMRVDMEKALEQGAVEDALVCVFDVNYLKRVNDTYGHAAGDEHLKRAAETITRSFGTEGACYRTGGDEFTVLIVGILLDERFEQCIGLFDTSVREQRDAHEGVEPLSLALGYAKASETRSHSIQEALNMADKRMYAQKRAMKAERRD